MTIATATWKDKNDNGIIDSDEINKTGFEEIVSQTYDEINGTKFLKHHLFGVGVMALFDDPRHDFGGYQYFLNDEYHLGIIKSSAKDEMDSASFGDIVPKGDILQTLWKTN